jgi:feruloyl esterase
MLKDHLAPTIAEGGFHAGLGPSAPSAFRANFPGTVAAAVPSFCRVEGVLDRRTGVDGKPYGIGFAIALPDSSTRC